MLAITVVIYLYVCSFNKYIYYAFIACSCAVRESLDAKGFEDNWHIPKLQGAYTLKCTY